VVTNPVVTRGVLQLDVPHGRFGDFGVGFHGALDLARRLVEPADVAERIAENLQKERQASVQLAALSTLGAGVQRSSCTRQALHARARR